MDNFDIRKALGQPNEIHLYNNDVVVKRPLLFKHKKGRFGKNANKKKIKELSSKSLKRLAFVASNTAQEFNVMVTLTYPKNFETDGKKVKAHLNHFLTLLRKKRKNIKYLWFMEFQKRGAPHFHILLSTKFIEQDWVAIAWNDIVAPSNIKHLEAGTNTERVRKKKGARNYAVKYAQKCRQKEVPEEFENVGRFWGHSRSVKPKIVRTIEVLGYDDLVYCLREWEYIYKVNHERIITVLYNASEYVRY